eukprot:scaffold243717_cov33-Tisochrysis_lutea.AAC.3
MAPRTPSASASSGKRAAQLVKRAVPKEAASTTIRPSQATWATRVAARRDLGMSQLRILAGDETLPPARPPPPLPGRALAHLRHATRCRFSWRNAGAGGRGAWARAHGG